MARGPKEQALPRDPFGRRAHAPSKRLDFLFDGPSRNDVPAPAGSGSPPARPLVPPIAGTTCEPLPLAPPPRSPPPRVSPDTLVAPASIARGGFKRDFAVVAPRPLAIAADLAWLCVRAMLAGLVRRA